MSLPANKQACDAPTHWGSALVENPGPFVPLPPLVNIPLAEELRCPPSVAVSVVGWLCCGVGEVAASAHIVSVTRL